MEPNVIQSRSVGASNDSALRSHLEFGFFKNHGLRGTGDPGIERSEQLTEIFSVGGVQTKTVSYGARVVSEMRNRRRGR